GPRDGPGRGRAHEPAPAARRDRARADRHRALPGARRRLTESVAVMDPLAVHRSKEPLPLDGAAARRWLGGKGASVAELTAMGVPVPPGFTLTTDLWRAFERDGRVPDCLRGQLELELALLEPATGSRFGNPVAPPLVAVRSGGPTSMPGMLDTVLVVGVDSSIARGLAVRYEAPHRFGLDVRRRFIEGYATVVLGLPHDAFSALAGR